MAQAVALGGGGGIEGAAAHRFQHHVARGRGSAQLRVFVHHARQQRLVERAPVDADAHRLLILDRALDHGAEIVVVFAADGDVAGIDAVLGQRLRAGRIFLQQQVAVVVEVADDGDVDAALGEAFDDVRNGFGGVVIVDGDADQLRAGCDQLGNLLDGRRGVGGVGIGHRLDDDRELRSRHARTWPILTVTVFLRWISGMGDLMSSLPEGNGHRAPSSGSKLRAPEQLAARTEVLAGGSPSPLRGDLLARNDLR